MLTRYQKPRYCGVLLCRKCATMQDSGCTSRKVNLLALQILAGNLKCLPNCFVKFGLWLRGRNTGGCEILARPTLLSSLACSGHEQDSLITWILLPKTPAPASEKFTSWYLHIYCREELADDALNDLLVSLFHASPKSFKASFKHDDNDF